jgi:hypothetical protein
MAKIPTDNHIRSMLDPVHPSHLQSSFDQVVAALREKGGMYFSFVVYTTERQVFNYGTLRSKHCHLYGKNGLRQDVCEGHRYRRCRTSMNQLAVDT